DLEHHPPEGAARVERAAEREVGEREGVVSVVEAAEVRDAVRGPVEVPLVVGLDVGLDLVGLLLLDGLEGRAGVVGARDSRRREREDEAEEGERAAAARRGRRALHAASWMRLWPFSTRTSRYFAPSISTPSSRRTSTRGRSRSGIQSTVGNHLARRPRR